MAFKLLDGFQKADSQNLPVVDVEMFADYLKKNQNFYAPEIRCIKAARSGRESYASDAVGYVQLKRTEGKCTIMAGVSPEHNIHNKMYNVQIDIDIQNCCVLLVQCHDCVASAGGCKHGLSLLGWMYLKSDLKTVTGVEAYWKTSPLSRIGTTIKYIEASTMVPKKSILAHSNRKRKITPAGSFLKEVFKDISIEWSPTGPQFQVPSLFHHLNDEFSWRDALDIHRLSLAFRAQLGNKDNVGFAKAKDFLYFCQTYMTKASCLQARLRTADQAENSDWFKLRYNIMQFFLVIIRLDYKSIYFRRKQ